MNLTPLGIGLLCLAALIGVIGQWSPAVGEVAWWRFVVALVVLGLAYEWLRTRRLAIAASIAGHDSLHLGRQSTLALAFTNESGRPWRLRFAPALPAAIAGPTAARSLALASHGRAEARIRVRPQRLGRHVWEGPPTRVRGPLGLAWWTRPLVADAELIVVPDGLGPRSARVGRGEGGGLVQGGPGGSREFHHLRDYRPGDPRHTIDWKAVARTTRLVTRVFSEEQHLEVLLMLDAGRTSRTEIDRLSQLGHYVNLAARFAEYCVAGEDRVGIVVFADRVLASLRPGRGMAAVRRVREVLGGLESQAVESDVLAAALSARRMLQHRALVIVLTDLYERSATSQLVQSARLLLPKHLPFVVGLMSEEVLALAERPARTWLDPAASYAARDYQRTVAASASRLTRLGAYATTARPAELDRKVLTQYARLRAQHRI